MWIILLLTLQIALAFALAIFAGRIVGTILVNRRAEQKRPVARMGWIALGLALVLALLLVLGNRLRHRPQVMENPFFTEWTTPFGVPPFDAIRPDHFEPAFERATSLMNEQIAAITSNNDEPTFENTILALDEAGKALERVQLTFELLCAADTNEALQHVEQQMAPRMAAHADRIRMNEALFERIRSVHERSAALGLDSLQRRLTEKTYRDFVRAGAELDAAGKERLRGINEELAAARVRYASNLLAANNAFRLVLANDDLAGLPGTVRDAAREAARTVGVDGWLFTLHKPSLLPFLTYSERGDLRRQLYEAYLGRCDGDSLDNRPLIAQILRLRAQRARLLGYDSHAGWVLDEEMARTPERVYALLDALWEPALERARTERAEMEELKRTSGDTSAFGSWDWWYYAEKLRRQKYSLDEEMLRPYLSLDNVRTGIFYLANRLYGITFRPAALPLYHPECLAYEVLDADNSHLGVLYLDFFPRPGKSQGAWCGEYRPARYEQGKRVAPVVTIVANFTRGAGNEPPLLSLDETSTFFHEFGHALHALFADVPYRGLREVERDFVEMPSQIMENWAVEPEMLRIYALHYRTGDPMPERLIQRIGESQLFNQGFMTTELLAASLLDMDVHTITSWEEPAGAGAPFDADGFEHRALNDRRGLIPQIAPRYRTPYFSHIFDGGYSAGYYSYIWAEVLDKDAYGAFRESGDLFDRRTAARFRHLLSRAGGADGMTLYRDFRGREPDRTALLLARGLVEPEAGADSLAASPVATRGQAPAEGAALTATDAFIATDAPPHR